MKCYRVGAKYEPVFLKYLYSSTRPNVPVDPHESNNHQGADPDFVTGSFCNRADGMLKVCARRSCLRGSPGRSSGDEEPRDYVRSAELRSRESLCADAWAILVALVKSDCPLFSR
jgi:hypothetical protein